MNWHRSSRCILTRWAPKARSGVTDTATQISGSHHHLLYPLSYGIEPAISPRSHGAERYKHSSTQIKRLFKKNPARRRVELKNGEVTTNRAVIPEAQYPPILEPKLLPNGWSAPLSSSDIIPEYPFRVFRTKNKPNNAVGFLPVYAEFRKDGAKVTTRIKKVSGDQQAFMNELRAALQIPLPLKKDEHIRIRTGGTIEVKGNRVREVKAWLAGLGF